MTFGANDEHVTSNLHAVWLHTSTPRPNAMRRMCEHAIAGWATTSGGNAGAALRFPQNDSSHRYMTELAVYNQMLARLVG